MKRTRVSCRPSSTNPRSRSRPGDRAELGGRIPTSGAGDSVTGPSCELILPALAPAAYAASIECTRIHEPRPAHAGPPPPDDRPLAAAVVGLRRLRLGRAARAPPLRRPPLALARRRPRLRSQPWPHGAAVRASGGLRPA